MFGYRYRHYSGSAAFWQIAPARFFSGKAAILRSGRKGVTEDENVYRILGRYRRRTDGRRGSGNDDALRQGSHENAGGKEYPQAGCRRGPCRGQHRFRNALTRRAGSLGSPPFLIKSFLGLDFGKSSGIIITLSHLATPRIQKLEPEQLWRSRLVGRGRMIGNHVGS